jgi:hypothetical protein
MSFEIRQANRSQAKPLIGLYAESGAGKTYTALLLARGFVGPAGRICMIETESGRGEAYADPAEYPEIGGYDVLSLRDDFSPENYGKAISAVERGGYDAMVIDSASHEWEAAGGVLDMAAKKQASGSKGMIVWQQPKIDHQKHFMLRFMQTPLSLVVLCMRAKYPMIVKPGKDPVRSDVLEPKQSEDILYEMFVHGWIEKSNHAFHPTKITAKGLRDVFVDGKPITLETGRQLAEWAKGGKTPAPASKAPETTEQQMARRIISAIKAEETVSGLFDLWNVDYAADLSKIKAASQKAYDFVQGEYNKRIKELEERA